MQTIIRSTLALAAAACMGTAAQAAVLNFEDRPINGPAFFLADYNGFTFGTNSIATTAWFSSDEVTTFYTPSSPTHYVATDFQLYTGGAFEATQGIKSAVDFVFDGAFFAGEGQIRYQLYNNGTLVYTSANDSAQLTDDTPLFFASGYSGLVDEVVILGKQGFYIMDDFTYNTNLNVPEPGAVSLVLLAGFMGFAATRRKRG